jgi:hypothetical protein
MRNQILTAMLVRRVHRSSEDFAVEVSLTLSERISDDLMRRIAREDWVDDVKRQAKYLTVSIVLRQSVDLVEVNERLVQLLKEWHQESSIILDDYRTLKIIRDDVNVADEYFAPEQNLPQAQLLSVQIQKQSAILREDYAEANALQQQEFDLMAQFLISALSRLPRS